MHRDQRRAESVKQAFANFEPILIFYRRITHQVPNIAHQHERAALESVSLVRMQIAAIRVQDPVKGFAVLAHRLTQITTHQSKPIAIGQNLIRPIYCGHGIFTIHNGGDRAFQEDIVHMRFIATTYIARWVNLNGNMQTVFLQNHLHQSTAIILVHPDVLR